MDRRGAEMHDIPPVYITRDVVYDDLKAVRTYAKACITLLDSERTTSVIALKNYRRAVRRSLESVDTYIEAVKVEMKEAKKRAEEQNAR